MNEVLDVIVDLTVVTDDMARQCLYVDGKKMWGNIETTVYARDLVDAAGNRLIRLQAERIDYHHDVWPVALSECLAYQ